MTIDRLRKRRDFLAANRGRRAVTDGFILLARRRTDDGPSRIGFTVTRKIGSSVVRNRLKRRLREAARAGLASSPAGYDFVLIGRDAGLRRAFDALVADVGDAASKVTRP